MTIDATEFLHIRPTKEGPFRVNDNVDIYCQSTEPGVIAAWSKLNGRFADNVKDAGGVLRIKYVTPDNAGIYRCEATGYRGVYHKDYVVDIIGLLKMYYYRPQLLKILVLADSSEDAKDEAPIEVQTVAQGSNILITCDTDLEGNVLYEWKKQGGDLPEYVDIQSVSYFKQLL